jgi:hypothetical protein
MGGDWNSGPSRVKIILFSTLARLVLRTIQAPFQWATGTFSMEVNQPGCEQAFLLLVVTSYRCPINLITNPNPICSHTHTHDNMYSLQKWQIYMVILNQCHDLKCLPTTFIALHAEPHRNELLHMNSVIRVLVQFHK